MPSFKTKNRVTEPTPLPLTSKSQGAAEQQRGSQVIQVVFLLLEGNKFIGYDDSVGLRASYRREFLRIPSKRLDNSLVDRLQWNAT